MKCNGNCFECAYEDCILDFAPKDQESQLKYHREYQAKWRSENRERYRANQNRWRNAHKEQINEKRRTRLLLARKCDYCGLELKVRDSVLKYGKHYFCNLTCVQDYLLDCVIAKGGIKTIIMPHTESEVPDGEV